MLNQPRRRGGGSSTAAGAVENLRVVHELFTRCIQARQAGRQAGQRRRKRGRKTAAATLRRNRCSAEDRDESLMERYAKDTRNLLPPPPQGFLLYRETSRPTDGWTERESEGHIYPTEDFPFNCPFLFLLLLIYPFSSFLFKKKTEREREVTRRKSTTPINKAGRFER